MSRRLLSVAKIILSALFSFAIASCASLSSNSPAIDYLITGGTVFSGEEGDTGRTLDIGIDDGEIVFVGASNDQIEAKRIIDAKGLIVSPGFIDPHTHALDDLLSEYQNRLDNYLTQGVTTVFTGNDGYGPVNTGETLNAFEKNGVGANVGLFIGHGELRKSVMGLENRPPTLAEMDDMRRQIREAMEHGALGLSAGLYYAPGSFADTNEMIALAAEAAAYGGVYDSHLRDESSYNIGLIAAVEEALIIGRESGAATHIAHIKALGIDVWGESARVIKMIEEARSGDQKVTADQYPWSASGTRISNALIPNWAKEGSKEELFARLRADDLRDRLRGEVAENLRKRGGAQALLIIAGDPKDTGKTLAEAAASRNLDPVGAAIDIVLGGDARVASFNMKDTDIELFMVQPWVMTSSDGTNGHPRKFASYPRKYEVYVNEKKTISLAAFIRRSSGLVADTFKICNRGYLKVGYKADILAFNTETFSANANFSAPRKLSSGVEYLFLNGQPVIDQRELMGVYAGEAVRLSECMHDSD